MRQKIEIINSLDGDLNPAGGEVNGTGLWIQWQNGPLQHEGGGGKEPNGAFVEDVLEACLKRLEFYESSKFSCFENREAIIYIKLALEQLDNRTSRRVAAGVEGTHKGN
jgi:hypothetical protein